MLYEKGQVDKRVTGLLAPVAVLWVSKGKRVSVKGSKLLLDNSEEQISLVGVKPCVMENKGEMASILLDYGVEMQGGIRIGIREMSELGGVKLRIRFGESAMEAMSELGEGTNATNDHATRDMQVHVNKYSSNEFGQTGFRFVRIDLLSENTSIDLVSVLARYQYQDIEYKGEFTCSDELLNKIWQVGAYTVHLNIQNYIWDGIKRDRLVWIGDLYPEIATIKTVFGKISNVEKTLDFAVKETPLPNWMNGFPTYSMWWVIIQGDWYQYTGDEKYLKKHKKYFKGLLKQLSALIDENGKNTMPAPRFVDWPTFDDEKASDAGIQALHIMAMQRLSMIFDVLKEKGLAEICENDIERLQGYVCDHNNRKQIAALEVLAGLEASKYINEEVLAPGGASGMSTFMGYFILKARSEAGDMIGALEATRQYWGGMLELGATTFWEDFDIEWMKDAANISEIIEPDSGKIDVHGTYGRYCYTGYRHSFCHGWASGVTPWLTETVLGVHIEEAGCKKIKITPQLGDLQWAKGIYPTPFGDVCIYNYKDKDGNIVSEIKAPEEIEVIQ